MGHVSAPERQGDSSHDLSHFYFKEGIIRGLKKGGSESADCQPQQRGATELL